MGRFIAFLASFAALTVALLFRRRGRHGFIPDVTIPVQIVITDDKDGCKATISKNLVELNQTRRDRVHWEVIRRDTRCPEHVRVCVGEWQFNGRCSDAPTEDEEHEGHCKKVKRNHSRTIKGKAKSKGDALEGDYKYSVLIEGKPVIDPIVRLVI